MDAKTRARLSEMNQRFYAAVADDFDSTRQDPWPGWERALSHVQPRAGSKLRVLDVGCGNGRFVDALADARGSDRFVYLGIDLSRSLLEHARRRTARYGGEDSIAFAESDILDPHAELPVCDTGFDLIALFGVLHHVPGAEQRAALLERLVERLRTGGVLAVTAWQFADRERFQARMLSLDAYNQRADDPIDPEELEPGDHLLRFGDSELPRYCHHCERAEFSALFAELPVRFVDAYTADGKSGDLNRYAVLERTS